MYKHPLDFHLSDILMGCSCSLVMLILDLKFCCNDPSLDGFAHVLDSDQLLKVAVVRELRHVKRLAEG